MSRSISRAAAGAAALCTAALAIVPATARAQSTPAASAAAATGAAATATPSAALRAEVAAQLADAERKLVALAEATPADKYAWRPAAGVRSTGEVFMHMVGGNYMIPRMAGAAPAAGVDLPRDAERSITDKARIVELLKASFAYARQAVERAPEGELAQPVSLFGRPATRGAVLVLMATHAHEHLGQSIAYARMNGIVPPWSQGGRAAAGN
jgi:uncharacterized damage-inducible protein DinB